MPQGFARDLNLAESDSFSKDSTALDNLAGAGRSNDISLFVNNLRNFSVLRPTQVELIPNTTKLRVKSKQNIAFSNRSTITHDGTSYTVVNSNGVDEFELVDELGNNLTVITQDLRRGEGVTKANIQNMSPDVLQTIDPAVLEEILSSDEEVDIPATTFRDTSISEFGDQVRPTMDAFALKRSTTLFTTKTNVVDSEFNLNGTITIINTANLSPSDTSPGLFIISDKVVLDENDNPTFDSEGRLIYSKARAFSNNTDPWSIDNLTSETITTSTQTNVNNLTLTNPRLNTIAVTPVGSTEPYTDFTHKILLQTQFTDDLGNVVNGEEYNLLCSLVP